MTLRDPRSAFQPNQWLGPIASGTGRVGTTVAATNTRAGERAAKRYPWMMCVKVVMPSHATSPVLRVTRTNMGNRGEPTFYNDSNRTIYIDEMRFVAMPPSNILSAANTFAYDFDLVRRFGVSIKHTNYDIVRDFLPLYALATWNNAASPILDSALDFSLPTPYLNPGSSAFQMRVRSQFASGAILGAGGRLGVGLCGKDKNSNPYILARTVTPTANGAILAFNENTGGGPVKDQTLTDINFNVSDIMDTPGVNYLWALQNEIQFVPPEGPRWQSPTDWFPVNGIVNQGNSVVIDPALSTTATQQNWVSYRPVTPHIVTPRQQIYVDLKCYQDSTYSDSSGQRVVVVYETPIWVIMLGTQEALV